MIDVRTALYVDDNTQPETLVKKEPDKHGAFSRLDALKRSLYDLESTVNGSDISNTSDGWHKAYAVLTKALVDCMKHETEIIEA